MVNGQPLATLWKVQVNDIWIYLVGGTAIFPTKWSEQMSNHLPYTYLGSFLQVGCDPMCLIRQYPKLNIYVDFLKYFVRRTNLNDLNSWSNYCIWSLDPSDCTYWMYQHMSRVCLIIPLIVYTHHTPQSLQIPCEDRCLEPPPSRSFYLRPLWNRPAQTRAMTTGFRIPSYFLGI